MRITVDDGVGLEVEVAGSGPALLMVHGFPGVLEDFADHEADLARHSTVVRFDHRGHGRSDKPDHADAYSFDRMAADTLAVADALGCDRFRLFGHSMGGMVARRVVLAAPDRIEALVLMGTSAGRPAGVDPDLADAGAAVALTEGMVVLRELLDDLDPLGTPADQRLQRERPGYVEYGRRNFFAVPAVAYAAILHEVAHQPDQLAEMRTITCPTLVVVGEQDLAFLSDCRAIADTVPGAELAVIEDAGHSPQFENPAAYLEVLERFLRSVDAKVGS